MIAAVVLTVFAASSLREPFDRIAALFHEAHPEVKVRVSYAGSQELRAQIEQGAPADVFASADMPHMDALVREDLAHGARIFARNQLAIVVARGNPLHVKGLADLARVDRVVLAAPEVPIGRYSRTVLARRGVSVGKKVISNELNVRQVAQKVALGEADAGIVYRTDARALRSQLDEVELPPSDNVLAEYPVAAVSPLPAARQFVAFLFSPAAQQVLAQAGFLGAP